MTLENLTNATHANNAINQDAWKSFHILNDVIDCMSMYLMTSLPGKTLSEHFHDLFEESYELEDAVVTSLPKAKVQAPTAPCMIKPLYWKCLCEDKVVVTITRPARTFAAAGTTLPPISEGVHFVHGDVSATFLVPCEVPDRESRGLMIAITAEELQFENLGLQDMDWELTPDPTDDKCDFNFPLGGSDKDDDGGQTSTIKVVAHPLVLDEETRKEKPSRLRRSARLAAKTHQMGDESQSGLAKLSFLGSVYIHGKRRSARLLQSRG